MAGITRALLIICLMTGIILPGSLADGIGFPVYIGEQEELEMDEDLQLVRIEVNETHQNTSLFVAIRPFSLKSYNLSLAVPTTVEPTSVKGGRIDTTDFMNGSGLLGAEEDSRKRNLTRGFSQFSSFFEFFRGRSFESLSIPLSSLSILTQAERGYHWGGFLGPSKGMTDREGVEEVARYQFQGISMTVYRFDRYESLKGLMDALELTAPNAAKEEIEKYDMHYVSVIDLLLEPPLEREKVELLSAKCPRTVREFFGWLAEGRPVGEFHLDPLNREMELEFTAQRFQVMAREEAEPRSKDEKDALRRSVYSLVKSYLSSPEEGYVLQFVTEHGNHLWYPLGTSSSWSQPVGLIEVLVDFPPGLWLEDPEPEPGAIYRTGSGINFFWRIQDGNPSSDIEGDIVNRTMPMGIYLKNSLGVFLNTTYRPMAALVNILVVCLVWYSATLFSWSIMGPNPERDPALGIKRSLTLGLSSYFLSVFSVLAVLPVLYLRDARRNFRSGLTKHLPWLAAPLTLFIPLMVIGWWDALISLVPGIALLLILAVELAFKHLREILGTHKSSRLARCWALATFMVFLMIVLYSYSLIFGLAAILLTLSLGVAKIRFWTPSSPGI